MKGASEKHGDLLRFLPGWLSVVLFGFDLRALTRVEGGCPPDLEELRGRLGLEFDVTGRLPPPEGGQIWMANHPFGGAEPFCLFSMGLRHRDDVLVFGNAILPRFGISDPRFLPLDILGGGGDQGNMKSLRLALRHLKKGGLLLVFPSGEVAHERGAGCEEESPWSTHLVKLAKLSGAEVVPVGIPGRAPNWFHKVGKLHPLLRTICIPRVLNSMRGGRIEMRIGRTVTARDLRECIDKKGVNGATEWLRQKSLALAADPDGKQLPQAV